MTDVKRDEDGNYAHSEPMSTGLIGGLELVADELARRVTDLERDLAASISRNVKAMQSHDKRLYEHLNRHPSPNYTFADEGVKAEIKLVREDEASASKENENLIDVLRIAHKGLKPTATVNQQNIAYYAVRGILSQQEGEENE